MANKPTNPKLYSQVKSEAKKKFRVYPSAYANAYAVKVCKGQVAVGGKKRVASGSTRKSLRVA